MCGPLPTTSIGVILPECKVYLPPLNWLSGYYDNYCFLLREICYGKF